MCRISQSNFRDQSSSLLQLHICVGTHQESFDTIVQLEYATISSKRLNLQIKCPLQLANDRFHELYDKLR